VYATATQGKGDANIVLVAASQAVGLVRTLQPAADIVATTMQEAITAWDQSRRVFTDGLGQ
jgi:hypothetical protein